MKIHEDEIEVENSMYASPLIWVPLSLVVAVLFAISNNITSLLSHYQFKAREIQAPGSLFANLIALFIISCKEKRNGYLDWFYNIYYANQEETQELITNEKDISEDKKQDGGASIVWIRVWITLLMSTLTILQYWAFTVSYHYASLANLNNGVIMALYTFKPLLNSVAFHFLFNQKLQNFEIIGI